MQPSGLFGVPRHVEHKFWNRKRLWKYAAGLGACIAIFFLVIAFAPSSLWVETKRDLEARGEVLDWEKVIPPEVPAEQNIFAHPVAASLLPIKGQPVPDSPLGVISPHLPPGSFHLGVPFVMSNLLMLPHEASGTNELSVTQLHDWFTQWDESFAQLREAGKRAHARLPGDYKSPLEAPIPNFVAARQLSQVLASRAKVHLLLGDSTDAYQDLETLRVIMKSFEAEPSTLVMAMIHVAIAGLYLDTIDEGFRANLWNQTEMRQIVTRLRELNLLAEVEQGIRSERVGVIRTLEALANRKRDPIYAKSLDALTADNWTVERVAIQFSPASWVRRGQARYAQLIQLYLDGIDSSARTIDQRRLNSANSEVVKLQSSRSPKDVIIRYVTPNLSKAAATVTRNQSEADRLALALALELFRARYGSYPDSLRQLVPDFIESLPRDLYTGQTVGYQEIPAGYKIAANNAEFSHSTNSASLRQQVR